MKYVQMKPQEDNSVPGLLMTNVTEEDGPAGVVKGGLIPRISGNISPEILGVEEDIITTFYCQFPPCTVVQHPIVTLPERQYSFVTTCTVHLSFKTNHQTLQQI